MPVEFDITLTSDDMYRFNMYQTYSGFHGIFSIVIAILIFVMAAVTFGQAELMYTVIYVIFGIVFLFYSPVTLYLHAKRNIARSEVLSKSLHYHVDEEKWIYGIGRTERVRTCLGSRSIRWWRPRAMYLYTATGRMPMSFRGHSWATTTRRWLRLRTSS